MNIADNCGIIAETKLKCAICGKKNAENCGKIDKYMWKSRENCGYQIAPIASGNNTPLLRNFGRPGKSLLSTVGTVCDVPPTHTVLVHAKRPASGFTSALAAACASAHRG